MAYSAELFVQQIVDIITTFGPEAAAVVGNSLGGAFTTLAAERLGARIGALALICPTGLGGVLDGKPSPIQTGLRNLIMMPGIGDAFFNALASRASLRWFLVNQAYADPASATPQVVDDYFIATHQPGARYVPAHFVGGALNCNIGPALASLDAPVLVAWGEHARNPSPLANASLFVGRARRGRLLTFANSKLMPHEEEPERCAAEFAAFFSAALHV